MNYKHALVKDSQVTLIVETRRENDILRYDNQGGVFIECTGENVLIGYSYDEQTDQFTPPE